MTTSMTLVIATVVLGVGTYAFRLAGPLLGDLHTYQAQLCQEAGHDVDESTPPGSG